MVSYRMGGCVCVKKHFCSKCLDKNTVVLVIFYLFMGGGGGGGGGETHAF